MVGRETRKIRHAENAREPTVIEDGIFLDVYGSMKTNLTRRAVVDKTFEKNFLDGIKKIERKGYRSL